ncbi:MAG: AraC family transcriptional regulator [Bacteroidaceae bacterium]|nr:AraC family transcriptional regulator [Bacteroidaceae bacterium]
MPYETSPSSIHNTRYVEYTDVFADKNIIPAAAVRENLLLFDTFQGNNPLLQIFPYKEKFKMYQKLYIYLMRGEACIEINGKPNTLKENMFISIMPENTISLTSASNDLKYCMMVVYPRLSNQIYNEIGVTYTNTKLTLKHFIAHLTHEQAQRICELYNDIKSDLLSPPYMEKETYIHSLLQVIVIESINIYKYNPMPLQGDSNSRQYDVYCHFLTLLNKHISEHRTVSYYAEALGISSKYLSYVCTCYSQKNASTWIDEAVIQKAKALIMVHNYTFTETSIALHFKTVSCFTRYFKRVTNMTPKEFLKMQKKQQ